ncbi:MAG: hypothetical protein C0487_00710 [Leptothrix sp. (in: Bacteria)]|nr:hypothetical protein [Leptothrix sp. (in: b-proteobacteria)]
MIAVRLALCATLGAVLSGPALAQALPEPAQGYLCCNMRTDGSWISDINYAEDGKTIIPAGTPVKVTGYGRHRVNVEIRGEKQRIGNDYSRDLDLTTFAKRYVVATDPTAKLKDYPPRIRRAIERSKLMPGMTREQVLMSVGYPISSENPKLDAKTWRFWLSSFAEFQVLFDDQDLVKQIITDQQTSNLVEMD